MIREGYISFKLYTTYDDLKLNDREVIEVLALAKREVALTMIHAENSDAIAWLTEALEKAGQTAPRHHADARVAIAEREATHRAISLTEIVDVPMLVVHVSGGEAMEQIAHARSKGLKVFAETCPQYILLTADDLALAGFEGAKQIFSPPLRDSASQHSVWRARYEYVTIEGAAGQLSWRHDAPKTSPRAPPWMRPISKTSRTGDDCRL